VLVERSSVRAVVNKSVSCNSAAVTRGPESVKLKILHCESHLPGNG
jgi:hypothetical protein